MDTTSLLLSNLRLLNIVSPEITSLSLQFISAESTLHSLFVALSPEEAVKLFSGCWPIYDPLQAKEFRAVAYKWLSELKTKGYLGTTIVRKSLLDDRQGERYELLLLSLSNFILRRTLPETFPASKRIALHASPANDVVRVHCLVHSYTLSKHVRQRTRIHQHTQSFAKQLHDQESLLSQKERTRKQGIDIPSIHLQCTSEISRWNQNWTAIKGEYVLTSLSNTLSSTPPTEFLSQSYQSAFSNLPSRTPAPHQSPITQSSKFARDTIANLIQLEKELTQECARLEAVLSPGPAWTPRKGSLRKSLPLPPAGPSTPSPRKRDGLHFTRSMDRLVRSVSESPRTGRLESSHLGTLEELRGRLEEVELGDRGGEGTSSAGLQNGRMTRNGVEDRGFGRSGIPKRAVSVMSRVTG